MYDARNLDNPLRISQTEYASFAPYLMSLCCILTTAAVAIRFGPVVGLAFAFGLMFMAFAYCRFETAVLLMIFLLPFDFQRNLGGNYALFADLAKLLLVPPFLLLRPYRDLLKESKLCKIFLGAFLFNVAISLGRAIDPPLTAKLLLRQFSALSFGIIIAIAFRTKEKLMRATGVILAMIVIQGLYGTYQWITGGLGSFWYWLNPEIAGVISWEGRAMGALGNMNALGGILNMGLCLSLPLLVSKLWNRWRFRLFLGMAIMLIGLVVTFSRAAWFAFALTALFLILLQLRRNRRLILVPILAGSLLLPISKTEIGNQVYQRLADIEPISLYGRLAMDFAALDMFLRNPFFGVGYGNWRTLFQGYFPKLDDATILEHFAFAHNIYLGVLSENGLVGFILFFVPLGYLIAKGLRFSLREESVLSVLIRAYSLAMLGAFIAGLADPWIDGNPPYASLFWAVVGLLISCFAIAKHSDAKSGEPCFDASQRNKGAQLWYG